MFKITINGHKVFSDCSLDIKLVFSAKEALGYILKQTCSFKQVYLKVTSTTKLFFAIR